MTGEKVTGQPCGKCGGTLRYLSNGRCVLCAKKRESERQGRLREKKVLMKKSDFERSTAILIAVNAKTVEAMAVANEKTRAHFENFRDVIYRHKPKRRYGKPLFQTNPANESHSVVPDKSKTDMRRAIEDRQAMKELDL